MKILAIDIETTGLDPLIHGITEFAAVFGDIEGKEKLSVFHVHVNPEGMLWSQYCLNLHYEWIGKINERIKAKDTHNIVNGYNQLKARFREWAVDQGLYAYEKGRDTPSKPTAAGKCFGTFDVNFLNNRFGGEMFRKRVLDPMHYYIDLEKDGDIPPDLQTCKLRAISTGCDISPNVAHNALDDALDVMILMRHAYKLGSINQWKTSNLP